MKRKKFQARWYFSGNVLGPDDEPALPTISIDLILNPEDKPWREVLRREMHNMIVEIFRKLDKEFYEPRFMDLAVTGTIGPDAFDDYVGRWHDLPDDDHQRDEQLHEYLGMTWHEYVEVTAHPHRLWGIIRNRRDQGDVSER